MRASNCSEKYKKVFLFPAESDTFVLITHLSSNQFINSKQKLVSKSIYQFKTFSLVTFIQKPTLWRTRIKRSANKRSYTHTLPSCLCHYWSLRNGQATSLQGSTVKGSSSSGVILSGTQVAITSQTQGQSLHVSPLISMIISPKLLSFFNQVQPYL